MKEFIISEEVLNMILNYLSKRSYAEVFKIIEAVQTVRPYNNEINGIKVDDETEENNITVEDEK